MAWRIAMSYCFCGFSPLFCLFLFLAISDLNMMDDSRQRKCMVRFVLWCFSCLGGISLWVYFSTLRIRKKKTSPVVAYQYWQYDFFFLTSFGSELNTGLIRYRKGVTPSGQQERKNIYDF